MLILKADNTRTSNHIVCFDNFIRSDSDSSIKINKKGDKIKLKKNNQYRLELQGNIYTDKDLTIKYSCSDFNPEFSKFCTFRFPSSERRVVTVITGTTIILDAKKNISISIILNQDYDIPNLQCTIEKI
jgi:hypothetical protein